MTKEDAGRLIAAILAHAATTTAKGDDAVFETYEQMLRQLETKEARESAPSVYELDLKIDQAP